MTLYKKIAVRMLPHVATSTPAGIRGPGAGLGRVFVELDGHAVTLLCHAESFDVLHGRKDPIIFSVEPKTLHAIAWWVIWDWWVRATWCGLRTRLWEWCVNKLSP
jgi:hypothetical protein